jgi:predicted phage terminase large subunit-like protein
VRLPRADFANLTRDVVEEGGFREFVKQAWPLVCPEELEWNWHLDVFCEELERIAYERQKDISNELALCVPPASTKSLIASVLWQPWVWGPMGWPESRWITCTYEQSLANDLSGESRGLVHSDWYQRCWPLEVKRNRDADRNWMNTKGGWRRAVGTGGPITGKHAHFHVGDDLIKEQESRLGSPSSIAAVMEKANGFWFGTLVTRSTKQGLFARVLVGQRLHTDDPPGKAIRDHGYQSIVFPMRLELRRADPKDQRIYEGELLCEARCDEAGVVKLEASLGVAGARGQLQQDPQPPGGQLIVASYLDNRWDILPGRLQGYFEGRNVPPGTIANIYGDCTFKGQATNDFVVFQLWARFQLEFWLIDQIRGQWGFRETKQRLRDFMGAWPVVKAVKLEDAANAPALEDDLKLEIPGIQLLPNLGCLIHQQQVESIWMSGNVHLPANAPWMGGSEGFVAEHTFFDGLGTRHDDQVATSGLALNDLSRGSAAAYAAAWGFLNDG